MSRQKELSQWSDRLASRLPRFSRPQIRTLACWSFAIVVCRYCGLSRVTLFLATNLKATAAQIRNGNGGMLRRTQVMPCV